MDALELMATAFLTGLIWTIQGVHYPLFLRVGPEAFPAYHREHSRRITWLVLPLMALELVTSAFRCFEGGGEALGEAILGFALTLVIWAATAAFQVPLHQKLARQFDPGTIRRLIATNWIRTAAWSLRLLLLLRWTFARA